MSPYVAHRRAGGPLTMIVLQINFHVKCEHLTYYKTCQYVSTLWVCEEKLQPALGNLLFIPL